MVLFLRLLLFWFLKSLLTDVKVAAEDVMLLKKEDGTDTHDDDTEDGDGDDGDDGDDVEEEGTIQAEAIAVGRTIPVVVVVVAFVDGTCCPFPSFVFSSSPSSSATSLFSLFVGTVDVVVVTVVSTPLRNNDGT